MSIVYETTQQIFGAVEEVMLSVEFGLKDLTNNSTPRKLHGLKTLVVFGRAVTNILQNLRSKELGFEKWYEPYVKEMKEDPLMKYFYDLRTVILKKALHEIGITLTIKEASVGGPLNFLGMGLPPPDARGLFIEGSGIGWIILRSDGSWARRYMEIDPDKVSMSLILPDPPKYHLKCKVSDDSPEHLGKLYLAYLRRMVDSAKNEFRAF